MPKKKQNWWEDNKVLRLRLNGFNSSGHRYGKRPVPFSDIESWLEGRTKSLLSHCAYCGRLLTKQNVSFDHVVPLVRGGRHSLSNMVAVDRTCNLLKAGWTAELYLRLVQALSSIPIEGTDMFTLFRKSFRRTRWSR